MATQRCPNCRSNRVRLGYKPTSMLMKLCFRYNLLCDQCNWEFNGFAIPGTVRRKTRRKSNGRIDLISEKRVEESNQNKSDLVTEILMSAESLEQIKKPLKKVKAKQKVKS